MGLFGFYRIKGIDGIMHIMTAKQLYRRILEDSKSDYNWIAHASELVRICDEPDFPDEYAKEIKIRVLKCFASIKTKPERISYHTMEDENAVNKCYNSMSLSKDEDVIDARKRYFSSILNSIKNYSEYGKRLEWMYGLTYYKVCDEWKKSMFEKYYTDKPVNNFESLKSVLRNEFINTLKSAERNGRFKNSEPLLKVVNSYAKSFKDEYSKSEIEK